MQCSAVPRYTTVSPTLALIGSHFADLTEISIDAQSRRFEARDAKQGREAAPSASQTTRAALLAGSKWD